MFRSYTVDTIQIVLICILGIFLVISAVLGFCFYIWYLKISNEQTQSRLLNILNGYLSAACMSGSLAVFNLMLHLQKSTTKASQIMNSWKTSKWVQESQPLTQSLFLFFSFSYHSRLSSTTSSLDCILTSLLTGLIRLQSQLWLSVSSWQNTQSIPPVINGK